MVASIATVTTLYVAPRLLDYMCSEPDKESYAKIDKIRSKLCSIKNTCRKNVSYNVWTVSELISKNVWITALVIAVLGSAGPLSVYKTLDWLYVITAHIVLIEAHDLYTKVSSRFKG